VAERAPDAIDQALSALATELRYQRGRGLRIEKQWHPSAKALDALAEHIYQRHYVRWVPPVGDAARFSDRVSGDPVFVESLALAGQDAYCWEAGWRVVSRVGEWLFVRDRQIQLFVHAESEVHPSRARPKQHVEIKLPCTREGLAPGFFYFFARAGSLRPGVSHLRLYLNVTPARARWLVGELLTGREAAPLRFEGKVANDPGAYGRVEPAVIYVVREDFSSMWRLLRRWQARDPKGWREGTPLFAQSLARGIAVAESPPDSSDGPRLSFGQHRCRLLAEMLWTALRRHEPADNWREHFDEHLRRAGIDPSTPHLEHLRALGRGTRLSFVSADTANKSQRR
jgi:hypothetical protein